MEKRCSKCGVLRDVGEFNKDVSCKDGLGVWCKQCMKIYNQKRYQNNQETIKVWNKKYRRENSKKIKITKKKYDQTHKNERNKRERNRRQQDPLWMLQKRISRSLSYYLKRIGSSKNGKSTFEILNITQDELCEYLNQFYNEPCEVCGIIITTENSQIDHIKPISLAKTHEDIIELNQLNNLRLICSKCNLEKRDKYEEELIHV